MTRLAILDDYQGIAPRIVDWASLGPDIQVEAFRDHLAGEDDVVARLEAFEIVIAMRERTPFPRSLISRLPQLRLLVSTGTRNAAIDVQAATDAGVVVCGTGAGAAATAELTWALILAAARGIPREDRGVREGAWGLDLGLTLVGRTLGIVGLGRLGTQVARVGLAFGMSLLAWSPNMPTWRAQECGARRVDKDELFATSDIITLHMVLSERSRGLVGERELALMKPSAYLVNTSRGPLVNEEALIRALRDRSIAGAALDVFDVEPLPLDHPLRRLENVVLSPHMGYGTIETYAMFFDDALEDVRAFLSGRPIRVIAA